MILWLCEKSLVKNGSIKGLITSALRNSGVKDTIMFNDLSIKTEALRSYNPKKMIDKIIVKKARENLDNDIRILKPSLIIINDEAALRCITGSKYSLGTTRGSLYFYNSIPCLVLDLYKHLRYKHTAKFEYELDLSKIVRWALGKQHVEPAFDYIICKTVDEVRAEAKAAKNSTLVTTDRETAGGFVTVTSYTYDTPEGRLRTFVIPFYDPFKESGAWWDKEEDEIACHEIIRDLNASPVFKGLANGAYDSAYDIHYNEPLVNYLFDTQNLMHSIWCEAPKALNKVASYFVDHYTYWKDESKGIKEDGWGRNRDSLERYWRYNGLDSYYTWLGVEALAARIVKLPWAVRNYNSEFRLSIGPCLAASLRGLKTSKLRHQIIMNDQRTAYKAGKKDMQELSFEADFNIDSPNNVAWLLYDVLGAKATRLQRKGSKYGPRSTDEKVLTLMKEQRNFFVTHAIERLLKAKKPGTVLSKYGNYNKLCYRNGRFLSWHNPSGTDTFRFNSGSGQFWTGTNGQNFQPFVQEMFVADPDYVLVDFDYSASDDWFIAHHAEDEDKIHNLRTKDVHSYHASRFFNLDYASVVKGKKNYEAWVVDAIKGCRQVSKKVAHGRNFCMGTQTLYNTAGRDLIVAAAKFMGHAHAEGLSDKSLIGVCSQLGDMYDHPRTGMYKRIRPWQDEIMVELKANKGLVTNAFGITRKFFGDPSDHETQRAVSSYFGQSGTSGNINRALNTVYYSGVDDGKLCLFLLQVHDSFKFLIHRSVLYDKVRDIKKIMEQPVTVNGREFVVPVAVEVGLTDGKHMVQYTTELSYEAIVKHERDTYADKFSETKLAAQIAAMNFDDIDLSHIGEEVVDQIENDQQDMSESVVLEDA